MPFITEEIWQRVHPLAIPSPLVGEGQGEGATIMLQPYPVADTNAIDATARKEMDWVMQVITGIRNIRSSNDISPAKQVPVFFADGTKQEHDLLDRNCAYIQTLSKAEAITWLDQGKSAPESATALVGNLKVLIPLGSLINKQTELERLKKEMDKLEKESAKAKGKLMNADFVARAPKQVVEQEQQRVQAFEAALANLIIQYKKVATLPD
jgi:valyl-tRNA synthetase